ncbi:MAG: hypothetical protein DMF62_09575 [Acidobacteria bacterium]|nr:MAG: hypothetical protein DMF62_09575 [Acidobacteriota bacterium]
MAQERTAFDFERLAGGSEQDLRFTNADSCTAIPMALFVLTVSRRFRRVPLLPSIVQASQFKVRSPEPITYHSSLENDIFVSDSSRFA